MLSYVIKSLFALNLLISFAAVSHAQDFSGAFAGMQQSDEPIQIEANKLEVTDSKGVALFNGNVSVVQGTTILKTQRLKVVYARGSGGPGGNIKFLEARGKLAVRSGDQTVTADKGDFNMQQETIRLSGNVIISQGQNVIEGCILNVNLKTSAASLEPCKKAASGGRVKMLFDTQSVPRN